MRTLRHNQQSMYYALQIGEVPIYNRDENGEIIYESYEDSDGNIIYILDDDGNKIPQETGEYEIGYSKPHEFFGNIAMSGGEAEAVEYGIDISAYDATLIVEKGSLPIDETSLLWFESEVGYTDTSMTHSDGHTADYKVLAVKPSLNFTKYILGRIVK